MEISIIIINYNTYKLTCDCIASVYKKTSGINFEIILVDNASSECDPEKFKELFPAITLVKSEKNLGFAGGNNLGLNYAKGKTILLLNSDTELVNNALKLTFDKLYSSSELGVVSSRLIYPSGKEQTCVQRFPSIKLELFEIFRLQKFMEKEKAAKILLGSFFDHKTPVEADWVWGTYFHIKREILQLLPNKKLPDDFFMYGEDMQWCYCIRQLGYRIEYFPEAVVIHHLSASTSLNKYIDKTTVIIKNEFYFLSKYYGSRKAKLIFKLKAFKYLTLSSKSPEFKEYAKIYRNSKYWRVIRS